MDLIASLQSKVCGPGPQSFANEESKYTEKITVKLSNFPEHVDFTLHNNDFESIEQLKRYRVSMEEKRDREISVENGDHLTGLRQEFLNATTTFWSFKYSDSYDKFLIDFYNSDIADSQKGCQTLHQLDNRLWFMHLNVGSLKSWCGYRFDDLKTIVETAQPVVAAISQTHLLRADPNLFTIDGYQMPAFFSSVIHSNIPSGGLAMFVKDSVLAEKRMDVERYQLPNSCIQTLWIDVTTETDGQTSLFHCCAVHMKKATHEESKAALRALETMVSAIRQADIDEENETAKYASVEFIILGGFNDVLSSYDLYNMKQLIDRNTRRDPSVQGGGSLMDRIFVGSDSADSYVSGTVECHLSDHDIIYCYREMTEAPLKADTGETNGVAREEQDRLTMNGNEPAIGLESVRLSTDSHGEEDNQIVENGDDTPAAVHTVEKF